MEHAQVGWLEFAVQQASNDQQKVHINVFVYIGIHPREQILITLSKTRLSFGILIRVASSLGWFWIFLECFGRLGGTC